MTTDLHQHIGHGVLAHDPDGLLDAIITAIEQVCFHQGIDRVHPVKGEGFTHLISPRRPAFKAYAEQWWGTDKSAWDRGTAAHIRRTVKAFGNFDAIIITETPGSHEVIVDAFHPDYRTRLKEHDFQSLLTSIEPAGMRVTGRFRTGINWAELKASGMDWFRVGQMTCAELKRLTPNQITP